MYLADMHCDTLTRVSSQSGLINEYNLSKKHPALQLFAAFVPKGNKSPEARRSRLLRFCDIYISEVTRLKLVPVTNCHDLNFAKEFDRRAAMLSVEGGGGLFADSEELNTLYRLGMRVLGLCWESNELCASAWEECDTGLTAEGKRLVSAASEMGIILDLSHLSDRSCEEIFELSPYPPLATHSNFREVCDTPRNLPRHIAKKIADRGGVIGLNLYPHFLSGTEKAHGEDIIRHIDYALDLFGDSHLGLGLDIDGTSGLYPIGLGEEGGSIHDRLLELLYKRYPDRTVEKIACENVFEFFRCNL
jgi:membrane dipeptidase